MEYRTLGRTGVSVSRYCLGTMMFGAMGNRDHDDCVRIIHRALDAGINFVDTADAYSRGESEEIVGRALKGRRDEVVLATKVFNPMGPDRNMRGNSRRWIVAEVENSLRRLRHRPRRPVPAPPLRRVGRHRGVAGRPHRPGARRQGAHDRALGLAGGAHRGGAVDDRADGPGPLPLRAGLVLDPQAGHRAVGAADLRPLRAGRDHLQPPRRQLAVGPVPVDLRRARLVAGWSPAAATGGSTSTRRPTGPAWRWLCGRASSPTSRASPVAHLATAWAMEHPVVTSVIIGPRTMEQLEDSLACAELRLDPSVLDAIDEIVPAGRRRRRPGPLRRPPFAAPLVPPPPPLSPDGRGRGRWVGQGPRRVGRGRGPPWWGAAASTPWQPFTGRVRCTGDGGVRRGVRGAGGAGLQGQLPVSRRPRRGAATSRRRPWHTPTCAGVGSRDTLVRGSVACRRTSRSTSSAAGDVRVPHTPRTREIRTT